MIKINVSFRALLPVVTALAIVLTPVLASADTCPPDGDGGDHALNRLKNRVTPPSTYREMTVSELLKEFPKLDTPRHTDRYSAEQVAAITPREQEGVELVGYLLAAKQSGPESTNCHSKTRRDYHVWIGAEKPSSAAEAKAMRAQAVVVEPTPNTLSQHQSWRLHTLQQLARQEAKVRISGWVMYDPEHPDQIGKTRGTLWEVHPVMKIEVWSGGQWREL
jgi:hypothetical protein